MERRQFLAASLASSALAVAGNAAAQTPPPSSREFYVIRRYFLQQGPQTKLAEAFFSDALIPALTRLGLGPIGAFALGFGPETPAFYLLIPGSSVEALGGVGSAPRSGCGLHEVSPTRSGAHPQRRPRFSALRLRCWRPLKAGRS